MADFTIVWVMIYGFFGRPLVRVFRPVCRLGGALVLVWAILHHAVMLLAEVDSLASVTEYHMEYYLKKDISIGSYLARIEELSWLDPNVRYNINWGRVSCFGIVQNLPPLHVAARIQHFEVGPAVVRALLKAGADPNYPADDGLGMRSLSLPLGFPAAQGQMGIVKALLAAGADPNVPSTIGPLGLLQRRPHLSLAAMTGNAEMVQILLDAGANPNIYFSWGLGLFGAIVSP